MTDATAQDPPFASGCRAFRPQGRNAALGIAVGYLMTKPAFARLKFGAWSRILVGQINRGQFQFVVDGERRVVGFLGWAIVDRAAAEDWLAGRAVEDEGGGRDGTHVIFNAWSADTPAATAVLLAEARRAVLGRETICWRRFYADGRVRPVRLAVTAFVARHVERGAGLTL